MGDRGMRENAQHQKLFVFLHIRYRSADQVIPLPGHGITFDHLRMALHEGLEIAA